ncbi:hypothetical protein A3B21_02350 [Candidatus Uhrbacteria bacterium RIFCSPLOWO2_01_FULL_47_24]|uniref:Uncharacterized protein n=1 Tax=Candidatus Uhrbacteria bacterium RIFCSPLOWO2_01_FULL_47_24 TaxID=1802401 RepID=A0A1F7UPL2_9BACT|nr:MAG: hypothetical protein A2753_04115 [Candidatus Uhrbacteria bacterium RIFCSPHIGHO2_01_FULL_47_11]OGL68097.1 MAG: hypothetical protein A3D58_00830 [Candidatus Uhrbacteria bacterium RIFCSPHIGHO2_02_FULL_46_47]OGL75471.1 MAG: hypothetical protein A3F52_05560 [Candidatus Uhrbacteria bacterium RIFCSPHIGHO2_12_FULL_47_11]OGL80189.1 MAG: hypothetical protein A3B21_02350 [Candidatus Uhrbacteria bacterium RIFCSPLOWO2_01_FULL_47_24]OGL84975.1 MAG: hypothetical protein A3J03_04735 [Candidatus Uhrbact
MSNADDDSGPKGERVRKQEDNFKAVLGQVEWLMQRMRAGGWERGLALHGFDRYSEALANISSALQNNCADDTMVQAIIDLINHRPVPQLPFTVEMIIPVLVNYDQKYELPQVLVNTEVGIERKDHYLRIPVGTHVVPLEVVNFGSTTRQGRDQEAALYKAGRRCASAEDFNGFEKATREMPLLFSISADGTSFNHPHKEGHGGGGRFVLSLIKDDGSRRVFAAWPELSSMPGWRMLVAPLELPDYKAK